MKTIALTHGKVALVSDEDYEMLSQFNWQAKPPRAPHLPWYAIKREPRKYEDGAPRKKGQKRRSSRSSTTMHRFILNPTAGQEVDHINRDGLDNRRENLRIATRSQQMFNTRMVSGATGHRGITFNKRQQMFIARMGGTNGPLGRITIARTKTLEEAIKAREDYMRGVSA